MYENMKILILGMARSGYQVAKLLGKRNNQIIVTDSKSQDNDKLKELDGLGIKFYLTDKPEDLLDKSYDLVIKNPAVFPSHPCIVKAHELKIKVVNEMEVAYHFLPKNINIIGVTGSNGKTTTTTLINEVLKEAKIDVVLGGNIGIPLSEIINENKIKSGDILLLEVSDHQLIDMDDFRTNISVLTNLCPTHLDYHGSYEAYKNVKHKIFNGHTKDNIAILNNKNLDSIELIKDIKDTKYYFNNEDNYYTDEAIYIDKKKVVELEDILLKGTHNYENILAMLLVMKVLKVDFKYALEVLKKFKGVEHRIEFVRNINGVEYYNDSKSTNPTATVTALKSFKGNIHLIFGGMDRNQEFDDLIPYKDKIVKIYAIGVVRNKIKDFCDANNILCEAEEYLKEVIDKVTKNVKAGDIVLLSPGAASWDQYARFEDRGDEFKALVNKL